MSASRPERRPPRRRPAGARAAGRRRLDGQSLWGAPEHDEPARAPGPDPTEVDPLRDAEAARAGRQEAPPGDASPWVRPGMRGPDGEAGSWAAGEPFAPPPRSGRSLPDLSVVIALLEAARTAVPRELQDQFTAFLRELLLALRGVIDSYLERLERPQREKQVEDIPID